MWKQCEPEELGFKEKQSTFKPSLLWSRTISTNRLKLISFGRSRLSDYLVMISKLNKLAKVTYNSNCIVLVLRTTLLSLSDADSG